LRESGRAALPVVASGCGAGECGGSLTTGSAELQHEGGGFFHHVFSLFLIQLFIPGFLRLFSFCVDNLVVLQKTKLIN
jgi:hypothetical protein